MKCKVCKAELERGRARCSMCGFPVMVVAEGDESALKKAAELARNYRMKKLEKASVALKVYTNEFIGQCLNVREQSALKLASGEELMSSDILWYDERFARLSKDVELKITVMDANANEKSHILKIRNPNVEDFWQVGVMPEPGLRARIVLGTREKYEASETISFI